MFGRTRPRSAQPATGGKVTGSRRGRRLIALAVTVAAAVAVPATAFAAVPQLTSSTSSPSSSSTSPSSSSSGAAVPKRARSCSVATFSTAQRRVEARLAVRTAVLGVLQAEIGAATSLTSSDRAALDAAVSTASSALSKVSPTVSAATTCAQLRAADQAMAQVRTYRVVAPKVRLTIAADRASASEALAAKLEPFAQQAIDAVASTGANVDGARSSYATATADVTSAVAATNGVVSSVLAVSPSGTSDANTVFSQARSDLKTADHDLTSARRHLRLLVDHLSHRVH